MTFKPLKPAQRQQYTCKTRHKYKNNRKLCSCCEKLLSVKKFYEYLVNNVVYRRARCIQCTLHERKGTTRTHLPWRKKKRQLTKEDVLQAFKGQHQFAPLDEEFKPPYSVTSTYVSCLNDETTTDLT